MCKYFPQNYFLLTRKVTALGNKWHCCPLKANPVVVGTKMKFCGGGCLAACVLGWSSALAVGYQTGFDTSNCPRNARRGSLHILHMHKVTPKTSAPSFLLLTPAGMAVPASQTPPKRWADRVIARNFTCLTQTCLPCTLPPSCHLICCTILSWLDFHKTVVFSPGQKMWRIETAP